MLTQELFPRASPRAGCVDPESETPEEPIPEKVAGTRPTAKEPCSETDEGSNESGDAKRKMGERRAKVRASDTYR